ncbi:MAG: prepilin-type N-terminal cleavage/methylation domain-containing protein [Candidatus Paceibacterota bacterium]|jgi:prepilin-type N-terminal cleavage/methylation domain-containing protein
MKKIRQNKFNNGFTLVETLVAITVLMIAIAGPLTVASKAYHAAQDARNLTIAVNLAQDAVEYINVLKENYGFSGYIDATCNAWSICGVSAMQDSSPLDSDVTGNVKVCSEMNDCDITYNPTDGYTHKTGGEEYKETPFKRVIRYEVVSDGIRRIAVDVSWQTGSVPNSYSLTYIMSDKKR